MVVALDNPILGKARGRINKIPGAGTHAPGANVL
jgi:hypothetical protein